MYIEIYIYIYIYVYRKTIHLRVGKNNRDYNINWLYTYNATKHIVTCSTYFHVCTCVFPI